VVVAGPAALQGEPFTPSDTAPDMGALAPTHRWRILIDDTDGEATPDITQVEAFREPETVGFTVFYTYGSNNVRGDTFLDTDQNASTGLNSSTSTFVNDIGADYRVGVILGGTPSIGLFRYNSALTPPWETVATTGYDLNFTHDGTAWSFEIPLALLGNDEGNMNVVQILGAIGSSPADIAPDAGSQPAHGTIGEPPWSELIAAKGSTPSGVIGFRVHAADMDLGNFYGRTYLDTDRIVGTEHQGPNSNDMGADYRLDVESTATGLQGTIWKWTLPSGIWQNVGGFPVFRGAGYYWFNVAWEAIDETDGYMDVVQWIGLPPAATPTMTDKAPDTGHESIAPRTKDEAV
jgi:hypothetical protein